MSNEEIISDIKIMKPEYIVSKYDKESLKDAIENARNSYFKEREEKIHSIVSSGTKYSTARSIVEKSLERRKKLFSKLLEIENILSGHTPESVIKTMRSKIVAIVKKNGFPVQKTHTTAIRGWTETSSGIKVYAEPSYHPYQYVRVEYYLRSGYTTSPSEERINDAKNKIAIIQKEALSLGYKVINKGLELEIRV